MTLYNIIQTNCAVYRQQFLDVIAAKCIQSSLLQPNSQSAPQPPQRGLPNESELTSIQLPKSDHCSPSSDKPLQVKIRPPLKIRKPDTNNVIKLLSQSL